VQLVERGGVVSIPLKYCHRADLNQTEENVCASELATAVEDKLARDLTVESGYFGASAVTRAESLWERYAKRDCVMESAGYTGGTEYSLEFYSCVQVLAQQRLDDVDHQDVILHDETGGSFGSRPIMFRVAILEPGAGS
jgi:hypothetical protein